MIKFVVWLTIALVVFVAVILVVYGLFPKSMPSLGADVTDAAVLGLITAGAVGIERIMETLWTVIGSTKGTWWPLKPIGERLNRFVSEMDDALDPFFDEAQAAIQGAVARGELAETEVEAARERLKEFGKRVDELKKLLPGDSRAALKVANEVSRSIVRLRELGLDVSDAAGKANEALAGVNNFVLTFDDNPGRRLLSIYAGVILGLAFAAVLGLDVLQTTLGQTPSFAGLGVVVTGILMGLGATPTHEVIKTLQEVKKSRKS